MTIVPKKKAKLKYGAPSAPKPAKPDTLDSRLALLVSIDDQLRELDIKRKLLDAAYETAETGLLEAMQTQGMTSIKGDKASASISRREVIGLDPEGWKAFTDFVLKHRAFDLIQRRVTQQAVKDREAEGETVPGIKRTTLVGLSLSRVKVKAS